MPELIFGPVFAIENQSRKQAESADTRLNRAIISLETWDRVQALLADNSQGVQQGPAIKDPSLLASKVVDQEGLPLVASHAGEGKVRYRYHVSRHQQHGTAANDETAKSSGLRIT